LNLNAGGEEGAAGKRQRVRVSATISALDTSERSVFGKLLPQIIVPDSARGGVTSTHVAARDRPKIIVRMVDSRRGDIAFMLALDLAAMFLPRCHGILGALDVRPYPSRGFPLLLDRSFSLGFVFVERDFLGVELFLCAADGLTESKQRQPACAAICA
jgi:hypothetical protein